MNPSASRPWYREPWPWLLAIGPVVVVIAGIYTLRLAITSNDGLVADDYYKQGLMANQTVARSARATALGITATLRLRSDAIDVALSGAAGFAAPERVLVTLSHPTRAGMDQNITLERTATGYSALLRLPVSGHWLVLIEDEQKSWRLLGNVQLPAATPILIGKMA